MRQIIGSLSDGSIEVIDVPRPKPGPGQVLVANEYSVISTGTERMLMTFGGASLVEKAVTEPGRVRQVLDKVSTDGLGATVRAVKARLEEPLPLGYSSAGVVLEVGPDVLEFIPGDRVATNAPHADIAAVPVGLVAKIPNDVASRDAAFTTIAAVGLNALRAGKLGVGGTVAIVGLGLVGQLVGRLARTGGYSAIGFDTAEARAQALEPHGLGFWDPHSFEEHVRSRTGGAGADAVIVTADVGARATGPDPLEIAAAVARRRGTIVLVGNGDPQLDRRAFYERELEFVVARAYGPGRGDDAWEHGRIDYPVHQERWTARRNFEVILGFMADGRLRVSDIEAREFELSEAASAYAEMPAGRTIASVFQYPSKVEGADVVRTTASARSSTGAVGIGVVGAGNFVRRVLAPALVDAATDLRIVASVGGLSSVLVGRKFGFESSTTNVERVLGDDAVEAVMIATRHESHTGLAVRALEAGKHVWLEKPLAITRTGLEALAAAWRDRPDQILMVGYNRRFAPTMLELRDALRGQQPATMIYTVNAGRIPADHWLSDPAVGGGRLVGEACHFVDVLQFLASSPIRGAHGSIRSRDEGTVTLEFDNGSVGTVHYVTNGHPSVPKERLEVFAGGRVFQLDNFRGLEVHEDRFAPLDKLRRIGRSSEQDKGHAAAVRAFVGAVQRGGPSPVPFAESLAGMRVLFDLVGE